MRTLGIVGGTGPESTIEYYRLLVSGYRERSSDGSYPPLLINSIDVNRLLLLAAKPDRQDLIDYLLRSVCQIARGGADFAIIAASTPHLVFDELSTVSPIPLLSIVQATCDFATAHRLKRLGLFVTRFTMQGGFYQETLRKHEIAVVLPALDEQAYVQQKYVEELVRGVFLPETRERMLDIARTLGEREQIDGLILGGTELPLLLRNGGELGLPLLDTTRIHVNAALDWMI